MQLTAFIIVMGSTIGAVCAQNPLSVVLKGVSIKLAFTLGNNRPATIQSSLAGAKEPVVRKLRVIIKSINDSAQFETI